MGRENKIQTSIEKTVERFLDTEPITAADKTEKAYGSMLAQDVALLQEKVPGSDIYDKQKSRLESSVFLEVNTSEIPLPTFAELSAGETKALVVANLVERLIEVKGQRGYDFSEKEPTKQGIVKILFERAVEGTTHFARKVKAGSHMSGIVLNDLIQDEVA